MIKKIQVNGFRSLRKFELELQAGLNILVGPNGSGKTNIISFFEFLSLIVRYPVNEAVSLLGGAGSIFRKAQGNQFENSIHASIYGTNNNERSPYAYRYDFTVRLSQEKDFVFFDKQRISYFWGKPEIDPTKISSDEFSWDLDLEVTLMAQDEMFEQASINLRTLNLEKIKTSPYFRHFVSMKDTSTGIDEKIKEEISNWLLTGDVMYVSLLNLAQNLFDFGPSFEADLIGGEAINIDPAKAKLDQDSAAPPGIKRDGSGLSATLFALSKNYDPSSPEPHYRLRFARRRTVRENRKGKNVLSTIEKLARLINANISRLIVQNSALDNRTQISVEMKEADKFIRLPFSSLSDGTIKWIALIAAIFTHRNIFAIEEPENFLHPYAQKELLNIMREEASSRRNESFIIMSTHSESLLNAAYPNEVIVVSNDKGYTESYRPQKPELIREEINRTGFGLGHYYISGILSDV